MTTTAFGYGCNEISIGRGLVYSRDGSPALTPLDTEAGTDLCVPTELFVGTPPRGFMAFDVTIEPYGEYEGVLPELRIWEDLLRYLGTAVAPPGRHSSSPYMHIVTMIESTPAAFQPRIRIRLVGHGYWDLDELQHHLQPLVNSFQLELTAA